MRYLSLAVISAFIISFLFAAGVLVGDAQALPSDGGGFALTGGASPSEDAFGNDAYLPAKPGGDCIETCSIQQEYYDDEGYGDEPYEEPYEENYEEPYEEDYGDADEQYNDDYGDPEYQEEVYPEDEYSDEYGNEEAYDDYGDPGTNEEGM
jgi:hypothetical protein